MQKLAQQGFLTFAQNSQVDYLRLAYVQAMSVKLTMPDAKYAVVVDDATLAQVTNKHRQVFDYIIPLPEDRAKDDDWKLANEWQAFNLTPFKETIKVESDILFTRSIDYWWTAFRLRDVVLSLGCKDYQGNPGQSRRYRQVFDDNNLPDTYNGLMYFRYSQTGYDFFTVAKSIYLHWDYIKDRVLRNCRDDRPTTDLVYALAANILGVERCTLPECDFINFTHMKNSINDWPESTPWPELVIYETDLPMIRINNINQYHPLHYHEKAWMTDEIIEDYEQCLLKKNS
jgi:hypothetical protein